MVTSKQSQIADPDPYTNLPDLSVPELAPPPYTENERTVAAPQDVNAVVLDPRAPHNQDIHGNPDVHITSCNHGTHIQDRSLAMTYLLAGCLGFLGAHHFYMGRPRFGILYIFTFGIFGLGWLTDLCRLPWLLKQANSRRKNPATYFEAKEDRDTFYTYLLWLPLGFIGAHHYYLQRWKWAVLYTFTAGLFGIGWLIDVGRVPSLVKDTNRKLVEERSNCQTNGPRLKKLASAYLMWIPPLGFLGGHQYYLGRKGFGALYTFTGGLCFIGWLVDGCRMPCLVRRINAQLEQNYQKASEGHIVTPDKTKHADDAYILHCGPFGLLGASQFYLGRYPWAVAYLFTAGFFGIGWIVEMFLLNRHVKEANQKGVLKDQIRIEYGPNTQIIVVTDGRVVAGPDTGTSAPVVLPAISVAGPLGSHQGLEDEQPPSYDSIVTERDVEGATGGSDNVTETSTTHKESINDEKPQDKEESSHHDTTINGVFRISNKFSNSTDTDEKSGYKRSQSQEDHFFGASDPLPEKRRND